MNTATRYDFGSFKLKYVVKYQILDVDILNEMFSDVEKLIDDSIIEHQKVLNGSNIVDIAEQLAIDLEKIKKLQSSTAEDYPININYFKDIILKVLNV